MKPAAAFWGATNRALDARNLNSRFRVWQISPEIPGLNLGRNSG